MIMEKEMVMIHHGIDKDNDNGDSDDGDNDIGDGDDDVDEGAFQALHNVLIVKYNDSVSFKTQYSILSNLL